MTKMSFMATSLVAALPAAFLAYLMVASFLGGAEKIPGMLMAVNGVTFLASILVAVLPVGILFFVPKEATAKSPKVADSQADEEAEIEEGTELASGEIEIDEGEIGEADEEVEIYTGGAPDESLETFEGALTDDEIPSYDGSLTENTLEAFSEEDEDVFDEEEGFEIEIDEDEESDERK